MNPERSGSRPQTVGGTTAPLGAVEEPTFPAYCEAVWFAKSRAFRVPSPHRSNCAGELGPSLPEWDPLRLGGARRAEPELGRAELRLHSSFCRRLSEYDTWQACYQAPYPSPSC